MTREDEALVSSVESRRQSPKAAGKARAGVALAQGWARGGVCDLLKHIWCIGFFARVQTDACSLEACRVPLELPK